jgi:signal transduction histidine kinase/DNA-binding response OmpR family regulator
LEGFEEEWNYLGSTNEAKYTNLNPGTYYFKVKAANNSGVWNDNERVLKITILTPWWKTFIFRISAVVLIISLVFLIIRIRTIQLVHQKRELKIKVEERTREIDKQQIELRKQAEELIQTNSLLILNQKEIERQKESITNQKNKLEEKNEILEQQKEQILIQKLETERMASQLHEADQKKIKFMTNVSHEFRTPLTLIYSPLESTLREFEKISKEKLHNRLKLMYRNTKRLLHLINEFLDISKIEAGLVKMNLGKGNVTDFIQGIINSYRFLAIQNNIQFNFNSEIEEDLCLFDADKIEKIVTNLLSNAFKFTPSNGSIHVELKVAQRSASNEIEKFEIKIQDSGIGIKDEFKNKIFDRFFQIESNEEQTSGTGIGLALTQELIAIYGGSVRLESEPGKGSTFFVTLPCHSRFFDPNQISKEPINAYRKSDDLDFTLEQVMNEATEVDDVQLDNKKSTILLVEDSEEIVQFLQEHFKEDFNFISATDGVVGFEKAISIIPQAIILDVMMPKMNGFQLCEKLKKDERTCHIPVIFLTALAEIKEQMEGLENGADDYITKPFDIDLLKIKVNNLIDTRKKLRLLYQKKLTLDSFELIPDSADEKLIRKILNVIDKEISNPNFGVEELSKIVGLSRTHLYRKISEITRQSPVELIRNLRLEKAAKLLRQNKFYISEVAYMSGFTEISYFRKIFKDFYGVSPSEFAKGIIPSIENNIDNSEKKYS